MKITIYYKDEKYEKFYKSSIDEYKKRLTRYCKLKMIGVKNDETLIKKLADPDYVILVDKNADSITSELLSEKITNYATQGISSISFVIINGFDADIHFDEALCLSPMDMALGLEKTLLVEQIYRAYRIKTGEPYHK